MTRTSLVALTLLHFVWQGALIHGALVVLLRLAKPRAANVRYGMGVIALALMAAAPMVTATWLTTSQRGSSPTQSVANALETPDKVVSSGGLPAVSIAADERTALVRAAPALVQPVRDAVSSMSWMLPWLVALWLTGVVILALRLLGGWLQIRGLVSRGWLPDSRAYDEIVQRLQRRLHVERSIRVLESAFVRAPAVIGWLRPALLLPVSMSSGLTVAQLEMILAHEIAHIRRHDYAVNLLQSMIETVLFYHPGVWWVSRQIRQEREHCCDDLAVATSGDARQYASALLELETRRLAGQELAVAATGGNLVHRVRRLLTPSALHGGEGSRWLAGVLVLAAVLLVGGGTRVLRASTGVSGPSDAPNGVRGVAAPAVQLSPTSARPDTVILYSGSEALDARWRWAHNIAQQRRFQTFWIGYVVKGDIDRGWVHFDRHSPVRSADGSTFSGHLRMKHGFEGLIFSGTRLDSLVPARAPTDVAILMSFVMRDGRPVLDRMHAGNFVFPVYLDKRALIWLGETADQPSIRLAEELFASTRTRDLREDLVHLVAVHTDAAAVRPVLERWLEREQDEALRAELVEALGYHADARTIGLLARTARDDRSSRVRSEAAETVSEIELPGAFDTLLTLTRALRDEQARREAVEGFGHRPELARAIEALRKIAQEDPSTEIQREAVETLGEVHDERAVALIAELARSHANSEVRREAVETLGEAAPIDEALRLLRRIVDEDRDVDVQREAVETLSEREDRRVLEMLVEIAEKHAHVDVQRQATESLGNLGRVSETRRILERLARTHPSEDVRREAIETYGEHAPDDSAAAFFESLVRGDAQSSIKIEALEALADMKHEAALSAILDVARAHPDREVRKKAIELLGDSHDPRARAMLERLLTRP